MSHPTCYNGKMPQKVKYTPQALTKAVYCSSSFREAYQMVSSSINSSSGYQHFTRKVKEYGIDTSHFSANPQSDLNNSKAKRLKWQEILVYDRRNAGVREQSSKLRRAMLESGIPWECLDCGNVGEWNGQHMLLEIDHIDENGLNNVRSNLRFLCPNCHSLRSNSHTWRDLVEDASGNYTVRANKRRKRQGKSSKSSKSKICQICSAPATTDRCRECFLRSRERADWPSNERLAELVWEMPTLQIASELGVSDVALAKRCKTRDIAKPPRGYWQRMRSEKDEN